MEKITILIHSVPPQARIKPIAKDGLLSAHHAV
jgi:hypothetical protein